MLSTVLAFRATAMFRTLEKKGLSACDRGMRWRGRRRGGFAGVELAADFEELGAGEGVSEEAEHAEEQARRLGEQEPAHPRGHRLGSLNVELGIEAGGLEQKALEEERDGNGHLVARDEDGT